MTGFFLGVYVGGVLLDAINGAGREGVRFVDALFISAMWPVVLVEVGWRVARGKGP